MKKRLIIILIILLVAGTGIGIALTHLPIGFSTKNNAPMYTTYPYEDDTYNSICYYFSSPKRYDVILFHFPDDEEEVLAKRVVGLPGETIEIDNGNIYMCGSKINFSFANETPRGSFGPYTVPENCYFVLADDINNFHDSRYWKNTFVRKDQIIGKVNE